MPAQEQKKQTQVSTQAGQSTTKREPEKMIFSWRAPARPFKRRDREFWVSIIAIAAVAGFILFIIEGVMPVILVISLVFLFYILSTVQPEEIEYKITNKGVNIADKRIEWQVLSRFWFSRRFESGLLVFETLTLPGRLELVIKPEDKKELKKAILNHIPEEEAPPINLDRAANWFAKKLPQ